MHHIDALNAPATTSKHLITTYFTQKHTHRIAHSHIPQRMTFDLTRFYYTLAYHTPFHQRVAMRRNDAFNTFTITCTQLITTYVTHNTPLISHLNHPPQRMTFHPCAFRSTSVYHIPLYQRVAMHCIDALNTLPITHNTSHHKIRHSTHTPLHITLHHPLHTHTHHIHLH